MRLAHVEIAAFWWRFGGVSFHGIDSQDAQEGSEDMQSRALPHSDATPIKLSPTGVLCRLAVGLSLASLCLFIAARSPASAHGTRPAATRVVAYDSTGEIRFIGATPGRPIADRPSVLPATTAPARLARTFLASRAAAFGIGGGARELLLRSTHAVSSGRSVVRFQQLHSGIPVVGGELVVNLDRSGNVLSAGAETLPATRLPLTPHVSSRAARRKARAVTADARGVRLFRLHATTPRLWIYDSGLLGGPGLDRPSLVWRIDVTGRGRKPVDELVLVDAQVGAVALHFSQIRTALRRLVCDAGNTENQVPCSAPARVEGGAPSSIRDVDDAYELTGAAYAFYRSRFGRDSIDGLGMPLVSTTRYCDPDDRRHQCPWPNAAWYPTVGQIAFGQGFASADDVVGHELTHAVVDHTSNLFPYYQAGAIDESIADTMGELFDQTNGRGTDMEAVRWRVGEDTPIGTPRRDMRQPSRFGQPDRMTSDFYTLDPKGWDQGGVHTNSGVGNKAAFLITDGGTFNGRTVRGLGAEKAARIYYELATSQLTSASDYADLFYALPQACRNLVGTAGISAADCDQVVAAVNAVEMLAGGSYPRRAATCPGGGTASDLFRDDLENPASGNWGLQTALGENTWFYPQPPERTYATSGHTNLWGWDQPDVADYSIAMTRDVTIPEAEAVYLRFEHAYSFVDSGMRTFDGGVVEYSIDGGQTWTDAGRLLEANGYDGVISPGLPAEEVENPLGPRGAFVHDSRGYGSSRANLGSLARHGVRFRFRIGTSGWSGGDYGWFIDDVRIYTCSIHPPAASIAGPSRVMRDRFTTWTISATDPAPDDQVAAFRYAIDWNGDRRAEAIVSHRGSLRVRHTYTRPGRHTIVVTVADHHGSKSRPKTRRIVVTRSGAR